VATIMPLRAPRLAPLVPANASFMTPLHPVCLGFGIRRRQHRGWHCEDRCGRQSKKREHSTSRYLLVHFDLLPGL